MRSSSSSLYRKRLMPGCASRAEGPYDEADLTGAGVRAGEAGGGGMSEDDVRECDGGVLEGLGPGESVPSSANWGGGPRGAGARRWSAMPAVGARRPRATGSPYQSQQMPQASVQARERGEVAG